MEITRESYPALFQVADASSVSGQRAYRWLIQIELALVLGGAAFSAAAAFLPDAKPLLASAASATLLGAIAMKLFNRQSGADQRWFDGRAVAETVKTQAWRYMMRIAPYDADASADDAFSADVLSALRARPDLQQPLDALPDDPRQISEAMRASRTRALAERRELYVSERLNDQAAWYRRRARIHQSKSRQWFWVSLAGQVVAAGIALYSVFQPEAPAASLVGFFAAVATAATAWTQLGRHDELSKSYALAYQELITIRTLADRVVTEAQLDQLVTTAEAAISREHTMWMAKLGRVERSTARETPR